jgi:FkbM family methyltransferase
MEPVVAFCNPDGTTRVPIREDRVWSVMYQKLKHFRDAYELDLNGRTIIDVGAARGEFLATTVSVWPKARFCLCEADARWEPNLRDTVEKVSRVTQTQHEIFMRPISHTDGETRAFWSLSTRPEGLSGFYPEAQEYLESNPEYRPVNVCTTTLDSLFGHLKDVSFVKVDVQGGEMDVMRGARALLERCRPFVLLELPIVPYNTGVPDMRASLNIMAELNYKLLDIWDVHEFRLENGSEIGVQADVLFAPHDFQDKFSSRKEKLRSRKGPEEFGDILL